VLQAWIISKISCGSEGLDQLIYESTRLETSSTDFSFANHELRSTRSQAVDIAENVQCATEWLATITTNGQEINDHLGCEGARGCYGSLFGSYLSCVLHNNENILATRLRVPANRHHYSNEILTARMTECNQF
jgi:hypothetical protein